MPRANVDQDTAPVRYPRTLFQHAHRDGSNTFPAMIQLNQGEVFLHFPDNWNGLDALRIWFLATLTEAGATVNITVNIATGNEVYNVHTQTVNAIAVPLALNEYEVIDITATFAVVLANLLPNDMMWIVVVRASGDEDFYLIGAEAQET